MEARWLSGKVALGVGGDTSSPTEGFFPFSAPSLSTNTRKPLSRRSNCIRSFRAGGALYAAASANSGCIPYESATPPPSSAPLRGSRAVLDVGGSTPAEQTTRCPRGCCAARPCPPQPRQPPRDAGPPVSCIVMSGQGRLGESPVVWGVLI